MDYNTLIASKETAGSIKNWVNDAGIDPVTILGEAQAHIYGKLRVQEMIVKDTAFAVAADLEEIAAPTNCLDVVHWRWTSPDIIACDKVTIDNLDEKRLYNTDGTLVTDLPRWYALSNQMFSFCVRNDVARTAFLRYFKRPADLDGTTTTNFLTIQYPRLLRCFCMGYANEWKKEYEAATMWLERGMAQIDEIAQTMDDLRLRGFNQFPTAD
jgi:hypothetical protein